MHLMQVLILTASSARQQLIALLLGADSSATKADSSATKAESSATAADSSATKADSSATKA